jgi:hypothetical protein
MELVNSSINELRPLVVLSTGFFLSAMKLPMPVPDIYRRVPL